MQRFLRVLIQLSCAAAFAVCCLRAQPVAVRQTEGAVHGFLALNSLNGEPVATGDLEQVARGSRVTSQLVFHFKDGSVQEETTVFSQSGHFRLLSDHLVQKGDPGVVRHFGPFISEEPIARCPRLACRQPTSVP